MNILELNNRVINNKKLAKLIQNEKSKSVQRKKDEQDFKQHIKNMQSYKKEQEVIFSNMTDDDISEQYTKKFTIGHTRYVRHNPYTQVEINLLMEEIIKRKLPIGFIDDKGDNGEFMNDLMKLAKENGREDDIFVLDFSSSKSKAIGLNTVH